MKIVVSAPPLIVRLFGRPPVVDAAPGSARLWPAFAPAAAPCKGAVDISGFCYDALDDAATLASAARVRLPDDGNPDPNAPAPRSVSLN